MFIKIEQKPQIFLYIWDAYHIYIGNYSIFYNKDRNVKIEMTYIKKISMTGFKSFGDRTVTIKLSSGFTCIVGPNGAGKSNIIDALCFALGRLSKKTMRAKSLEDLIFAGSRGKNPSQRA